MSGTSHPPLSPDAILDASPDCIVVVAEDGGLHFANLTTHRELGYPSGSLAGRFVGDLNPALDAVGWSALWAYIADGTDLHVRSAWRKANGKALFLTVRVRLVTIGGRPLAYAVGRPQIETDEQPTDVSYRRALERLAEIEQIYSGAPIGVCLLDRDYRYVRINQRLADFNGSPAANHIGRTVDEMVPTIASSMKEQIRPALERGQAALDVEIHGRTITGEERDLRASYLPFRSPSGEILGVLIVTVDVTDLKQIQRRLAESEALMLRAQEVAHVGAWSWDLRTRRARWNRELYRICGLPEPEGAAGETGPEEFLALVHPSDRERVIGAVRAAVRGLERLRIEYRLVRPDGTVRWVYGDADLERGPDGEPLRLVGIGQDITDRREAEAARLAIEVKMQQAQKLETVGVLAGGIAHDFNNLLVSILGNVGLLMAELPAETQIRPTLARIEQAALRASDLVNQMLAYAGRSQLIAGVVNLNDVVTEMAQLLSAALSKSATLRYELAPDAPKVSGDATQVRQVVMNLITNASDALPDGLGTITVATGTLDTTEPLTGPAVAGERLHPGCYAFLRVTDTGCGITADAVHKIFDPFFTTKFTGRGLGLSAVQGIIRAHKGTILVDSEPGRGSTFTVVLPRAEAPSPVSRPAAPCDVVHDITILIVDDEPDVRETAREILVRCGCHIVEAADGVQALAKVGGVDAVLLDLTMPRMGGAETLAAIRRLRPQLPVVLSSGYVEDDVMQQLGGTGQTTFVQKPYRPADLRQALARAVAHRRPVDGRSA